MNVKKLVSLMLIVAMIACSVVTVAFASDTATAYAGGTGTESDPYLISNAAELRYFRDQVNSGVCVNLNENDEITGVKYIYVKLTDDIDLGGESWTPIGSGKKTFRGTFDGDGHIISNFVLKPTSEVYMTNNSDYVQVGTYTTNRVIGAIYGLFATVDGNKQGDRGNRGCITKLGLENVAVNHTASDDADGSTWVAGLIGVGAPQAKIEECYIKNITATAESAKAFRLGGLVGNGEGFYEMNKCYVAGMNATVNSSDSAWIAPLAPRLNAIVTDCYTADCSFTNLSSKAYAISNTFFWNSKTITNLYSDMDISSYSDGRKWSTAALYGNGTGASGKVDAVSTDALKNLENGKVNFADGAFAINKSGGYPKLSWEKNLEVYELTVNNQNGGSLAASETSVEKGMSVTVSATPNDGYAVTKITANGATIWSGNSTTAINVTDTPEANTVYTAFFKKPLNPNLGRYLEPSTTGNYSSVGNLNSGGMSHHYAWNSSTSSYNKLENKDGFFTISPKTTGTNVTDFTLYNHQYSQRMNLKSTVSFGTRINQIDSTSLTDGILADFRECRAIVNGTSLAIDRGNTVSLCLVKNGDKYQWILYRQNNSNYTEIGDSNVDAELGKWYDVDLDIDFTIGQARATIKSEDGQTSVIEASNTGLTQTYEKLETYLSADKSKTYPDGYYATSGNLGGFKIYFNGNVTMDMREFAITQEHFYYVKDLNVTFDGPVIAADTTAYALKPVFSGDFTNATPPIYIAVYNDNTKQLEGVAAGRIVDDGNYGTVYTGTIVAQMFYKPKATLDLSKLNLANGSYTVKVMIWSDEQVPFKPAVTKTLTVADGSYTLN